MYMTSVLWSDQNDIVIYRSFRDFKKMHKQMKKAFPATSKLKRSKRIIPKFKDRRMKRSGQRKAPTKSLNRLKFLQKYCNELLSCDPRVAQSAELIQFFHPKDQDLQPEFSKNSIMIMPSDNDIMSDGGHGGGGNVTQPFVTETYRCVAPYETKCTKNKPFKVAVDEKVDVLIKDKAGWWLVENEDKHMAWFPAPYLEKVDDDDDGDEEYIDGTSGKGMLYTAIKSYKATKDDEITVNIGSVVEVVQQSDNGWWLIRYNSKTGYIPTMYLRPYNYPHIRMTAHHENRRFSSPLQVPSSTLTQQTQQLSRSQGNLLQLLPVSSARPLQPDNMQRSHSLNILSEERPPQSVARTAANAGATASTAKHATPPIIMVEMDGEKQQQERSLTTDSEGSFVSDSDSFSDDLSSSSASSFLNFHSTNDERLRLSRTPPPMVGNRLSPTTGPEGKMLPSVSDPNLYKSPTIPKVPPRPQTSEILTRCTTVTRKNAARGHLSPTQTEILSR
ncbi:hypothetical protein PAMP_009257 [Pampus punctatissimus]